METIADILREMRNRTDLDGRDKVDNFSIDAEFGEYGGYDALSLIRAYADRIEAAHEREIADALNAGAFVEATRACKDSLQVGNGAKQREALEKFVRAYGHEKCLHATLLAEAYKDAKSALAAPPRNCERFVDELDAQIEFLNDVWLISVTKDSMLEGDKFENWIEEMKSRYAKWLFAEAEGGAK